EDKRVNLLKDNRWSELRERTQFDLTKRNVNGGETLNTAEVRLRHEVNVTYSEVRRQSWWVRSNVRSYEIEMERYGRRTHW
ncbi:MAG: hypothetical protein ACTS6G_05120, partial [Candidatus Hodgkinia cicadicola]